MEQVAKPEIVAWLDERGGFLSVESVPTTIGWMQLNGRRVQMVYGWHNVMRARDGTRRATTADEERDLITWYKPAKGE